MRLPAGAISQTADSAVKWRSVLYIPLLPNLSRPPTPSNPKLLHPPSRSKHLKQKPLIHPPSKPRRHEARSPQHFKNLLDPLLLRSTSHAAKTHLIAKSSHSLPFLICFYILSCCTRVLLGLALPTSLVFTMRSASADKDNFLLG